MRTECLRKPEVRDAILDAAGRLFRRYGYRKTTVEDIAMEARISRATIYLYFPGKEELALTWTDREQERLHRELEPIALGNGPAAERVRMFLTERVSRVLDRLQDYAGSLEDLLAGLRPLLFERRVCHQEALAALLADVIREGQVSGEFAPGPPLETARLLVLAMNALLPHSLSPGQVRQPDEVRHRAEGLADLLVRGMSSGHPTGPRYADNDCD